MGTKRSRPTIKDVARVARVHFTTVSMALRGHPDIPQVTRDRIRQIADRIGYVKDPVDVALSQFRTRARREPPRIAYVANRRFDEGFERMPHMKQLLDGVAAQATALGYELEVMTVAPGYFSSDTLSAHLNEQKIRGLIIGAFVPGLSGLSLDWNRYAIVAIDSRHVLPGATSVSNDQREVVRLAFRRLRQLGYRRIGMAVGRADEDGLEQRHLAGLLIEQASIPEAERMPPLLFPYDATDAIASELLGRWTRENRLDAVMCNWGNVRELLTTAGLNVPAEVACACLCLTSPSPGLAGVFPNLQESGVQAVSLLSALLKSECYGLPPFPSSSYVQSYWHDGASAPSKGRHE